MGAEDKSARKTGIKIPKNRLILLLMAALGLFLVAAGSIFGGKTAEAAPAYTDVGFYTEYLEGRIRDLCLSITGIEEANVFLTIDCSSEYIYEDGGGSDYLILSGADGEEAVMLCEIYPKVRGIAVVCTGGDIPRVQQTVTELLAAALGLPTNKIKIAGG